MTELLMQMFENGRQVAEMPIDDLTEEQIEKEWMNQIHQNRTVRIVKIIKREEERKR